MWSLVDLRVAVLKFTKQCETHVGERFLLESNVKMLNLHHNI